MKTHRPPPGGRQTVAQLLEANLEKDPQSGCWVFTGPWDTYSYGRVWFNPEKGVRFFRLAHHMAAYAWKQAPWRVGFVCHRRKECVPACVNPAHLIVHPSRSRQHFFLMRLHRRDPFDTPGARLTPDALEMVLDALAEGRETHQEIADRVLACLGVRVSATTVGSVKRGESWRAYWYRRRLSCSRRSRCNGRSRRRSGPPGVADRRPAPAPGAGVGAPEPPLPGDAPAAAGRPGPGDGPHDQRPEGGAR